MAVLRGAWTGKVAIWAGFRTGGRSRDQPLEVSPSPGGRESARPLAFYQKLPGQKRRFLERAAGTEDSPELHASPDPGPDRGARSLTRRLSRWRSPPLAREG